MNSSAIPNNQQDRTVNHLNSHHNNDNDDDEENNEIQPTREDQLSSIRRLLDSRFNNYI